jgi:hypothetical protein
VLPIRADAVLCIQNGSVRLHILRTIRIDTAQHRGETQRKGIRIDIQVIPTIEGIAKEKDELLEKAVEIINSKN